MSKNPAWNAYNEAMRKIEETYDTTVKPLRTTLYDSIKKIDDHFEKQFEPLRAKRKKMLDEIHAQFNEQSKTAWNERNKAVLNAKEVLNAELKASQEVAA